MQKSTVNLICQECMSAEDVPLDKAQDFRLCKICQKVENARKERAKEAFLKSPYRLFTHSAQSMTEEGHITCIYSGRIIHRNPYWKE